MIKFSYSLGGQASCENQQQSGRGGTCRGVREKLTSLSWDGMVKSGGSKQPHAASNFVTKDGSVTGRIRKPKVPEKTCLSFGQYLKIIFKNVQV